MAIVGPTGLTIAASDRIEPQGAGVFTIESLPPGRHEVICTIPHQAQEGMVGTLEATA
jgi:uncharacterized cupredoxin-like copper-binding protein